MVCYFMQDEGSARKFGVTLKTAQYVIMSSLFSFTGIFGSIFKDIGVVEEDGEVHVGTPYQKTSWLVFIDTRVNCIRSEYNRPTSIVFISINVN